MSIRFDSLQFQNNTQFGEDGPIVAEVGAIVDNLPSDDTNYSELKASVDEGYYYVAMICRKDPKKNSFDFSKDKRYVVSKTSIIEYIFGFADENEIPDFVEDYSSISEAVDSDFLDFFLFENSLVQESIEDRAAINSSRRESAKNYNKGKTTIQIDSLDDFRICTRLTIDDSKEIVHEIILNSNSGGYIIKGFKQGDNNIERTMIIPEQNYILIEDGRIKASVPALEYLYRSDHKFFPAFAKAEMTTKKNVLLYFKQNEVELESRFTKIEIEDLKIGILGNSLGIKDYRV